MFLKIKCNFVNLMYNNGKEYFQKQIRHRKSRTLTYMQALGFMKKITSVISDSSHLVSIYSHAYVVTNKGKKSISFPSLEDLNKSVDKQFISSWRTSRIKNGQDP